MCRALRVRIPHFNQFCPLGAQDNRSLAPRRLQHQHDESNQSSPPPIPRNRIHACADTFVLRRIGAVPSNARPAHQYGYQLDVRHDCGHYDAVDLCCHISQMSASISKKAADALDFHEHPGLSARSVAFRWRLTACRRSRTGLNLSRYRICVYVLAVGRCFKLRAYRGG